MNKKIALVTGGTSGIGKEIVQQLVAHNVIVVINFAHDEVCAQQVHKEISEQGGEVVCIKADVCDEMAVKSMMNQIQDQYGRLDYLINNAGVNKLAHFEDYALRDWQEIFDINLTGKFLVTQSAIPLLKKSETPRVVNIASRLATRPDDEVPAYCCAEAGVVMLTQVSALALAKYNIRVNAVSPGLTHTPMTESVCSEEEFAGYAQANPAGRVGTTNDVAQLVLFLLSDESEFINGENINISGGILLK